MAVLVRPNDHRGPCAIAFVLHDQWKRFVDDAGRLSWSIPSTRKPGLYYRTTADGCTCPDLKYRPWIVCKHMLAVRLQEELDDEEGYAF